MVSALEVVTWHGGIATRSQIIDSGVTEAALASTLREGGLRCVRRAHFASSMAIPDAVVATRVGGALCGVSAARSYGLWGGTDPRIHVALAPNAARSRVRVEGGRLTSDLDSREIVRHWTTPSTSFDCWRVNIECLRQVVAWCDEETAIATLDTARTRRKITEDQLRSVFCSEPARSRMRASRSRRGSESGLESLVRQRLVKLGYCVEQQVVVSGVGRIDLQIAGTRVCIEVDGREHHDSGAAFAEDRRRDAEAARHGLIVVRLTYAQIVGNWPWCERVIRSSALRFQEFL